MKELHDAITIKLGQFLNSEDMGKLLSENVEKCITRQVENLFGYGGPVQRIISEKFKQEVGVDLENVSFLEFRTRLINEVVDRLNAHTGAATTEAIDKRVADLMEPAPATVCVQDLVDMVKNDAHKWSYNERPEYLRVEVDKHTWDAYDIRIWAGDGTYSWGGDSPPDHEIHVSSEHKIERYYERESSIKTCPSYKHLLSSKFAQMAMRGTVVEDINTVSACDLDNSVYED